MDCPAKQCTTWRGCPIIAVAKATTPFLEYHFSFCRGRKPPASARLFMKLPCGLAQFLLKSRFNHPIALHQLRAVRIDWVSHGRLFVIPRRTL
jgi:hypothetical protein